MSLRRIIDFFQPQSKADKIQIKLQTYENELFSAKRETIEKTIEGLRNFLELKDEMNIESFSTWKELRGKTLLAIHLLEKKLAEIPVRKKYLHMDADTVIEVLQEKIIAKKSVNDVAKNYIKRMKEEKNSSAIFVEALKNMTTLSELLINSLDREIGQKILETKEKLKQQQSKKEIVA